MLFKCFIFLYICILRCLFCNCYLWCNLEGLFCFVDSTQLLSCRLQCHSRKYYNWFCCRLKWRWTIFHDHRWSSGRAK